MTDLPAITSRAPKTKRGATRQGYAILAAYRKAFADGGQYGFDMPTFRLNWPEGYAAFQALKAAYATLPV